MKPRKPRDLRIAGFRAAVCEIDPEPHAPALVVATYAETVTPAETRRLIAWLERALAWQEGKRP